MDNASTFLDLSWSIQPREGRAFVAMFRWKGKQVAVSTGEKLEARAKEKAPGAIAAWFKKQGDKAPTLRPATLSGAVAGFLEAKYLSRKPATAHEVEIILRRLAAIAPEDWGHLTRKTFKPLLLQLKGKASPKYWKNILVTVRKFWRWAVEEGLAVEDVTKGIEGPRSIDFKIRQDIWPEEMLEAVSAALPVMERQAIQIIRWTGMDPADLFHLRKRHFVKDKGGIWKIVKVREKAKSNKELIDQPISSKVRELLIELHSKAKGPDSAIFPTRYKSAQVFSVLLWRKVSTIQMELGYQAMHIKALRHSFATFHAERDVPIDVLRAWMGHSADSRVLDRVYLHRGSSARYMD